MHGYELHLQNDVYETVVLKFYGADAILPPLSRNVFHAEEENLCLVPGVWAQVR